MQKKILLSQRCKTYKRLKQKEDKSPSAVKRNKIKLEQKRDKSFLVVERNNIKLEEKSDSVVSLLLQH